MNTMRSVLIVEDDKNLLFIVEHFLRLAGFRVLSARTAEKGLEIARCEIPNLIVMDLTLPGLNGKTAVGLLKHDPDLAPIPVLLISGRPPEELNLIMLVTGAADVLPKPFRPDELVVKVRRWTDDLEFEGSRLS